MLLTAVISIHIVARFFMQDAYTFSSSDYLNNSTLPSAVNTEITINNSKQEQTELTAVFPRPSVTSHSGFSNLFITSYRSF